MGWIGISPVPNIGFCCMRGQLEWPKSSFVTCTYLSVCNISLYWAEAYKNSALYRTDNPTEGNVADKPLSTWLFLQMSADCLSMWPGSLTVMSRGVSTKCGCRRWLILSIRSLRAVYKFIPSRLCRCGTSLLCIATCKRLSCRSFLLLASLCWPLLCLPDAAISPTNLPRKGHCSHCLPACLLVRTPAYLEVLSLVTERLSLWDQGGKWEQRGELSD